MPSSRKLAAELGVSRNTISLAYQHLTADGYLLPRARSGIYVDMPPVKSTFGDAIVSTRSDKEAAPTPFGHLRRSMVSSPTYRCPPDWHRYKFPFIEGEYDETLFPVASWREVSRMALGVSEVAQWSIDSSEADDDILVEEIRTKLLPRRGIAAARDEILVTVGEQQALHLVTELFTDKKTNLGMEDPSLPSLRDLFEMRGANITPLSVDDDGLVVSEALKQCDIVHVSPSRQRPSGVTMTLERRKALVAAAKIYDFVIIEDDFECEMTYLADALPSLYNLDENGRVIYVASISKVLAPGVRLGYLVASGNIISQARRLRSLTTRRPSPNNQRAAAFFLSLGHYDAMLVKLKRIYQQRLMALRDALNHYRPLSIAIPAVSGGTAYWVKGPDDLDGDKLVAAAEAQGILIEPAKDYFFDPEGRSNMFRLGVTSIPIEKIRPGIEALSRVMRDLQGQDVQQKKGYGPIMQGPDIRAKLSGATLLYKTVYGEPCRIVLNADGTMQGWAGYAHEDRDTGRWWIEGDLWCRQWLQWAYGEQAKFYVSLDSNQLIWLNADRNYVDSAVIV